MLCLWLVTNVWRILDVSSQDATVYWGLSCWQNTGLWFDHLQIRLCLYFPVLTWTVRFSTQLNAPSCSPETEPPATLSVSLPLCVAHSPIFQKLQPYVWRDPRFKHAPWETTLLSTTDFELQVYKEGGGSSPVGRGKVAEGVRRDREIKKNLR